MEIWKDIPEYEGLYQASNLGRIKSLYKKILCGGRWLTNYERILKVIPQKTRGLHVTLCKENIQKQKQVHVLVAQTFITNIDNKPCVNHINAIRNDNRVENLEWVTYKENTQHASKLGLMRSPKYWTGKSGEQHCRSKKVEAINILTNEKEIFFGTSEASRKLNISQACIHRCCYGIREKSKGFKFKFI